MKNFLNDNTMSAFVLILAIGSISGVGMAQFVIGSDGDTLKNLLGGCIYSACKDTKISGSFNPNVTGGIVAGCVFAGCKDTTITGQPTPNTATLIVTKKVVCGGASSCPPGSDYTITIDGKNATPDSFKGSTTGTTVTLSFGQYIVSESGIPTDFKPSFSGNCVQGSEGVPSALGNINAGETQECTITNTFQD